MRRGLFVTGTDTGVGKTLVTAGLLKWVRDAGVNAAPMKPIQTGARRDGSRLCAPDLETCLGIAGLDPAPAERQLMVPYLYEPACSPHLAGRMAANFPDIPRMVHCFDQLQRQYECVLVEGAGGVLVPLDDAGTTMLELMKALALPVLLVARAGLGTINHTLLSLRALREAQLTVVGVLLNELTAASEPDAFILRDNAATIQRLGAVEVLGTLPYFSVISGSGVPLAQHLPGISKLGRYLSRD